MHIIFKEQLQSILEKYTVLELDTFKMADGAKHTACCVIENLPIVELSQVQHFKELHENLIKNYGLKNWDFCEHALEHLMGKWGGELDSFYTDLKNRIQKLKTMTLDDSWSPIIARH
jgi:hypothetical protein